MTKVTIEIPLLGESGNKLGDSFKTKSGFHIKKTTIQRVNWFKILTKHLQNNLKEMTQLWPNFDFVNFEGQSCVVLKPEKEKVRMTIVSYRSRELDKINLYTAHKGIQDACLPFKVVGKRTSPGIGLLWDDAPSFCELEIYQEKSTQLNARTVITVERMNK